MNIKEETKPLKKTKPGIGSILLFVIITVLTLYAVFHGQDLGRYRETFLPLPADFYLAGTFFCLHGRHHDLVSAGSIKRPEKWIAALHLLLFYRFFLFGYHAFRYRRTADAALLYE